MTEQSTRQVIIDTARRLFAERGFTGTTIRDVAEAAGVSPALVMKLTGSKAELFRAAAPDAPDVDGPSDDRDEPPGRRLVRAVVDRRDANDFDYWATAPFILQEAADRDAARADLQDTAVSRIAAAIGDRSTDKVRTRLVITLLLGLAGSLRTVELIPPDILESRRLIEVYGELVQAVIDDPRL